MRNTMETHKNTRTHTHHTRTHEETHTPHKHTHTHVPLAGTRNTSMYSSHPAHSATPSSSRCVDTDTGTSHRGNSAKWEWEGTRNTNNARQRQSVSQVGRTNHRNQSETSLACSGPQSQKKSRQHTNIQTHTLRKCTISQQHVQSMNLIPHSLLTYSHMLAHTHTHTHTHTITHNHT